MGGFTLLEHTADVGVSAFGDTLGEAMSWLATGMFSLIVDPDTVAPNCARTVSVTSRDQEALAVDWLNELLYLYETTGFLVRECRVSMSCGNTRLDAHCVGENLDPDNHRILTVIKAATYHQLSVIYDRQWGVSVILDV